MLIDLLDELKWFGNGKRWCILMQYNLFWMVSTHTQKMTIAKDLFAKNATKKKEIRIVMFDVVFVSGILFSNGF